MDSPGPFEVRKGELTAAVEPPVERLPLVSLRGKNAGQAEPQEESSQEKPRPEFRPTIVHSLPALRRPSRLLIPVTPGTEVEKEDEDEDEGSPFRNFECPNYSKCLSLAATLDWYSFTCSGCDMTINEQLIWRAHHRLKSDPHLAQVFNFPLLNPHQRPHP